MSQAPRPSRRALLGAAGLAVGTGLLSACTGDPTAGPPSRSAPPSPAPVDPDDVIRAEAVARERSLIDAYDRALAGAKDRPALQARTGALDAVRQEHQQHLVALLGESAGAPPSARPSSGPASTTSPGLAQSRPTPDLAGLVRLERDVGGRHAVEVVTARDGVLAGLLASLAASEASHPVALA